MGGPASHASPRSSRAAYRWLVAIRHRASDTGAQDPRSHAATNAIVNSMGAPAHHVAPPKAGSTAFIWLS
jgi:hypothetical protein